MSMIKYIVGCLLFMCSCSYKEDDSKLESRFGEMTTEERDSLANWYNSVSNYMLQPSESHRRYKDSAMMAAPNHVGYRQVGSYSYKKTGEHIKAMKMLNQACDIDVKLGNTDCLEYRAWSLIYYYRAYEKGLEDIAKIEEMSGAAYNVCWGEPCGLLKGQALYKLGKYEAAAEALGLVNQEEEKRGLDISQNFLIAYYIGRCYHALSEYGKAIKAYDEVLVMDDSFTEALFYKALANKELGLTQLAKSDLEKAYHFVRRGKKMDEPYIERFDEVFEWMVKEELGKI